MTGCVPAAAQDSVFLRNGHVIPGRVRELGARRVDFDAWTATDTLRRSKDLRLVRRIRFADGRSWPEPLELRRERQRDIVAQRRGRLNATRGFTYLGVPAFQVLGRGFGPGAGIGHERQLGPSGRWSLNLDANLFRTTTGRLYKIEPQAPYTDCSGYYGVAAIQYHPFGRLHRTDFSLGLGLPAGLIVRTDHLFDGPVQTGTRTRRDAVLGTELRASLRVYSSRAASIMFTAGGGPLLVGNGAYGGLFRAAFCVGFRH